MPTDAPELSANARSITAASLADVCSHARQLAPDLGRPFRYVLVGSRNGELAASVAASHPQAQVWVWDPHAANVEATRRHRDALGLDNLLVWERSALPARLDGDPVDFVVIDGVLDTCGDTARESLMQFAGDTLRPGGLLCLTYRTAIGWSEIQPVVNFMRYVTRNYAGDPAHLAAHVLDLLGRLVDGGAGYLLKRPRVAAWVSELFAADHADIEADYLRADLRPLSHAQATSLASGIGCTFLGGAHPDVSASLSPELTALVDGAATPVLRETFADLAVRRTHRADVFRSGVR